MKVVVGTVIVLVILVITIKFVEPVNDFARTHFPEPILSLLGEKPKGIIEKSLDKVEKGLEDMGDAIEDAFK
ncbi:MAG: hypothetical protein HQK84_04720 [Nitrospinae bacterium]|nr:hypothetical protein [Nitrospinota bacterium]